MSAPFDTFAEAETMSRDTAGVLRFFNYAHLSGVPRAISETCADLADEMVERLPNDPELTVGLRKLLEAKDAFVRAAVAASR